MSFLKQILNPFVEFDDTNKTAPAQPIKTPKDNKIISPASPGTTVDENAHHPLINENKSNVPQSTAIPTFSQSGTITGPLPEHEKYFERLIDEANANNPLFKGTDFKEFVESKVDIDDITDENLKYKTAFNVLKSTGLTIEKLKSTGQEYVNLIGRDLNAFQSAHAQQYQKEVRQKELMIQKKAEELQTLTQKINTLKADINKLTQDINLTKEKMNTTKNSFLLAGESKQTQIQKELDKIAQYFN
jgi:hypothetical protein